ncbi:hypothetical protein AX14_012313 [Amanita brunnescens Koide BX004]|nr:hypothetical protein AX14_012313 [Amanita brunnescens Koide BX004]
MEAPQGKRVRISEQQESNKKRKRVAQNEFLDIEAAEGSMSDEETEGAEREDLNFIQEDEVALGGGQDIAVQEETSNDDLDYDGELDQRRGHNDSETAGLDDRMAHIVRQYEAHASEAKSHDRPEEGETASDVEELVALTERAMRMPTAQDPDFWIVRVYKGMVEETFWAMYNRLYERPGLVSSVLMPPTSHNCICIESTSHQNVVELCVDLSTVQQPPNAVFVPLAECVQWVNWSPPTPRIKSPSWVRMKKRSQLRDLLDKDHYLNERLLKYGNDLGYVSHISHSHVEMFLVPRLLVEVGRQGSADYRNEQKKRRRQ